MRRAKSEIVLARGILPPCDICLYKFDSCLHRPLILPSCGHTFCRECLTALAAKGKFVCPSCRETCNHVEVDTLPTNFSLLSVAIENRKVLHRASSMNGAMANDTCEIHDVRNSFWCKTCEVAVCGECLFDIHKLPDHEVIRVSNVISQMKERCREMMGPTKETLTRLLRFGLQRVLVALSDVQTISFFIADMIDILKAQEKALDLDSVNSAAKKAEVLRQKVLDYRNNTECHKKNRESVELGGEKSLTNAQRCSIKGSSGNTVDLSEGQEDHAEMPQPNRDRNNYEKSTVENPSPINERQLSNEGENQDLTEASHEDPTEKNCQHKSTENYNSPEETQHGPGEGLQNPDAESRDPCVFKDPRVLLVAFSDDGRVATVKLEENGLHIYSLRPNQGYYNLGVKLAVLEACVSKTAPVAFFDISAGRRPIGRIYFELNGEMQRAKQFMALCLGNLGPSYLGTGFDEVYNAKKPGEYARGGDYSKRGGQGGTAIMADLEWGGKYASPKKRGVLCGVGGEQRERFGALFAICVRDDPASEFQCSFGRAIEGIETLEIALRHEPFHLVHVANCGLVIRE